MNYTVLGIGNPIIDIYGSIRERELASILPQKEFQGTGPFHISAELFDRLLSRSSLEQAVAGGGSYNAVRFLSSHGIPSAFFGSLGKGTDLRDLSGLYKGDLWEAMRGTADFFRRDMARYKIIDGTYTVPSLASGRSLNIKTENGGHALFFSPAAASAYKELPLRLREAPSLSSALSYIYLEGFVIPREDLVSQILAFSRRRGADIVLDLGAKMIASRHRQRIIEELLPSTAALFGTSGELEALELSAGELSRRVHGALVVEKRGSEGSILHSPNEVRRIPAVESKAIDTTGAGDIFAAAFLWGRLQNKTIEESAYAAAAYSAKTVEVIGACPSSCS